MKARALRAAVLIVLAFFAGDCSNPSAGLASGNDQAREWNQRIYSDLRENRNDSLQELISGGTSNLPLLIAMSGDAQLQVRQLIYLAVEEIGPQCVPGLIEFVQKGKPEEAYGAARCLALFGGDAIEAAPVLARRLKAMESQGLGVGADACKDALIQIGPEAVGSVVELVREEKTREKGFAILKAYGIQAMPALDELQRNAPSELRESVYRASIEIRLEERGQIEHFLARDSYSQIMRESLDEPIERRLNIESETLSELGLYGMSVGQAFEKLKLDLASGDKANRRRAARYLAHFGALAQDALPLLIEELKTDDIHHQWWTANTIGAIGPGAEDAVPALLQLLNEGDSFSKTHAAAALAEIGFHSPEASDLLREMLETRNLNSAYLENDDYRRTRAAVALARMDPERAIPILIANLSEPQWSIRRGIIEALAVAGPSAAPALQELLNDANARVRQGASLALLKISMRSGLGSIALAPAAENDDHVVAWASSEAARMFRLNSY